MVKKMTISQMIKKTSYYAQKAGKNITEEDVRQKYEEYIKWQGEENANIALENTLKSFKEMAKMEEVRLFCLAKAECIHRFGVAPANRSTLKAAIREGRYISIPAVQEYKNRFC